MPPWFSGVLYPAMYLPFHRSTWKRQSIPWMWKSRLWSRIHSARSFWMHERWILHNDNCDKRFRNLIAFLVTLLADTYHRQGFLEVWYNSSTVTTVEISTTVTSTINWSLHWVVSMRLHCLYRTINGVTEPLDDSRSFAVTNCQIYTRTGSASDTAQKLETTGYDLSFLSQLGCHLAQMLVISHTKYFCYLFLLSYLLSP